MPLPQGKIIAGKAFPAMLWHPFLEREAGMTLESILIFLLIGAVAGWLAGLIVKGGGFGLVGDIIVGIIGAFVAGWLLPKLGISIGTGIVAAIIHATIGAVVLLVVIGLIRRIA